MDHKILSLLAAMSLVLALFLAGVVAQPGGQLLAALGMGVCASLTVQLAIKSAVARISDREKVSQ